MERELNRLIGAVSAAMQALYQTVVVKREFTQKVHQLIFALTITYGHKL